MKVGRLGWRLARLGRWRAGLAMGIKLRRNPRGARLLHRQTRTGYLGSFDLSADSNF